MITRTQVDPEDGSTLTVLISSSLEEGFADIAAQLQGLLGPYASVVVDVRGDEAMVSPHLGILQSAGGVRVQVRSTGADPFFAGQPRAQVSAWGSTWESVDRGETQGERIVDGRWQVQGCPTGVHPAVHEVAETLMWDADDAGNYLSEEQALAEAHALVRGPSRRPAAQLV